MQKGKRLRGGDTLGIVAPSGPCNLSQLEEGMSVLEGMGFRLKEAANLRQRRGYLAGDDEARAAGIMEMFDDDGVDGVICAKGGYGANRMASLIDVDVIRANPKVFLGYSDITTLHLFFNQGAELITFHGPMAAFDFGPKATVFSMESMVRWVMDGAPGPLENPPDYPRRTLAPGKARGQLVGGNLNLLAYSIGTPWEIDSRGKILFIEEIEEEPYKVDGMLIQLVNAGKLQECAGIVLGDFNNCEVTKTNPSLTLEEALADILLPLGVPVMAGLRAGHCEPKLTLPLGAVCALDADAQMLTVLEDVVG